jgi:hypothetical protein
MVIAVTDGNEFPMLMPMRVESDTEGTGVNERYRGASPCLQWTNKLLIEAMRFGAGAVDLRMRDC